MAAYAILNADNICINRVEWNGVSLWAPPANCRAVLDPDNKYPRVVEEQNDDGP